MYYKLGSDNTAVAVGCSDYEILKTSLNDTITSIGPKAFLNSCVEFSDSSNGAVAVKNNLIMSSDGKTLFSCPKSNQVDTITIPDGVETIADNAFITNESVSEIHIPDSLKTIGEKGIGFYVVYDFGYEEQRMVNGVCVIGNASENVKQYCNDYNIGVFSAAPKQNITSVTLAGEKDNLKNLRAKKGTIFDHPQFISTTFSQPTCHSFYSEQDGVVMIIYAEKNALQNLPSGYIAAFHPEGEYEYFFQKGSRFELIDAGVRWYDGSGVGTYGGNSGYERYIKVRLLGGKDKPDTLAKPKITLSKSSASLYVKRLST